MARPVSPASDDGLVVDLSLMKGARVDPKNRTVRVGPGCTTGDVDHATQAFKEQAVPFKDHLDNRRGGARFFERRARVSQSPLWPDGGQSHRSGRGARRR